MVGLPPPEVAMNAKPHPPSALEPSPNTDEGKALFSMAIYIFCCPLGQEYGFPEHGRTQQHGDVRKAKHGTATKEQPRKKKTNSDVHHGEWP